MVMQGRAVLAMWEGGEKQKSEDETRRQLKEKEVLKERRAKQLVPTCVQL